jgi:NAD-dependent dihydropyrimidine dehydrogenase PreA subunit
MVDAFPVIVRPKDCTYCGLCEEICPQKAIHLFYSISLKKNNEGDSG